RVRDAGFNILPVPEPRGVHMSMADHEKPVAFQALAAASSDFSQLPYAILPNPVYDQQKIQAKRKAKQRGQILAGLVIVASIVALAVAPLIYAKSTEAYWRKQKNDAEHEIKKYAKVIKDNEELQEGLAAVDDLKTGVPAYTKFVCNVLTSAPSSATPTTFKSL